MARPEKEGLDYFPLDVDIAQDDKVYFIEAKHGLIGFAIIVRLLIRIYKNGYFCYWSDKEALIFSKQISTDINVTLTIINDCINEGIFDKEILEKYGVLTSKGIQKRFIKAATRRKKLPMIDKYLLVDPLEYPNVVIVTLTPVNEDINQDNVDNKYIKEIERESKEKVKEIESKEENTSPPSSPSSDLSDVEKIILDQFGDIAFKTWFSTTEIIEGPEEIKLITEDKFKKDFITNKYKGPLEKLTGKKIIIEEG